MPHFNKPNTILDAHHEFSTYTLDLPLSNMFPMFHASLLRKFVPNDPELFPSHKFKQPGPILTAEGLEEYFIKWIIDECNYGCGKRYLIHWKGYNSDHNTWLAGSTLKDNIALDVLEARNRDMV